jgi:malonyl-CoA O-methyltransferase
VNTPDYIDKQRVRRSFDRAADSYDEAALLQREVCERLLERLDWVRLSPHRILDAGVGTGEALTTLHRRYPQADVVALDLSERMLRKCRTQLREEALHAVCGDIEQIPIAANSFDLVFSSLTLQWCNDIGAALQEMLRVLRPGGLLMFTTFGPDTLKELRSSWRQVDDRLHVNDFADMHDIGDAMLHCRYADPVMEAEVITVEYREVDKLLSDLRAIGANTTATGHRRGLMSKSALSRLRQAYEAYRQGDVLPASYEIVYGHAWKPESGDSKTIPVEFG